MKKLKNIKVENKKVLVRVDYNVPIKNGLVLDNNRIIQSLETINYLIEHNAKIILMSHMGKVKKVEDKMLNTLKPVKIELEKILNRKIYFAEELKGKALESQINSLKPGEILLMENTRYMDVPDNLESSCDEELSKYWASLGDVFILDAFGSCHRNHASTYGISKYLPHAVGFLIERELKELDKIKKEKKTFILGGSKVSDKIGIIKNLMDNTDKFLIGGAMCATFLTANGNPVGSTFVETDKITECKNLLKTGKIIIPIDYVTENGVKELNDIFNDEHILDIGPKTIELFKNNIDINTLLVLNGTLGKYEEDAYQNGTKEIFNYLKENIVKTVVLGGDTSLAAKKYNFNASYISTGGGASLEYLEGKEFETLKIMEESK